MFNNYYNESFRRNLVVFASMFNDLNITLDNGKTIRVPLHYSQKEKFIEVLAINDNPSSSIKNISYPIMAYEMIAMNFAPERNKNKISKIRSCNSNKKEHFMYNRVPYDFMFELYIATKRLDDVFKIVEQILPNFSPSLTVRIKEHPNFDLESNVTVDLTSSSFDINYDDDFSDVRNITWQLSFTLKSHLYQHEQSQKNIESVVVNAVDSYNDDSSTITKYMTSLNNNALLESVTE